MGDLRVSETYEALDARLGPALRGVVGFAGEEYEGRFRADVRAAYSEAEVRAFVDDAIVDQLGKHDDERAFKLGDIEGSVRIFEQSWVLRIPLGRNRKRGCLVSVERGGDVSMDALDDCLDIVAGVHADR